MSRRAGTILVLHRPAAVPVQCLYRTGPALQGEARSPGQANSTTAFTGMRGGGGGRGCQSRCLILALGSFQYRSAGDKSLRDCQYDLKC